MHQYKNLLTGGMITSRRDFGKGLAAILAAGSAPAICKAALLGARGAVFVRKSLTLPAPSAEWDILKGYSIGKISDVSAAHFSDLTFTGSYVKNTNNVSFTGGYGLSDKISITGTNGGYSLSYRASFNDLSKLNGVGWSYAGIAIRYSTYIDRNRFVITVPTNVGTAATVEFPNTSIDTSIHTYTMTCSADVGETESAIGNLYVDGVLKETAVGSYRGQSSVIASPVKWSAQYGQSTNRCRVFAYGSSSDGTYGSYQGLFQRFAIYDKVLTEEEVASIFYDDTRRYQS